MGRTLCRAGQQERVEDLVSPPASQKRSQLGTLADSDDSDDEFTTPKTKKPRLTDDERLEVYQNYYDWVYKDKKRGTLKQRRRITSSSFPLMNPTFMKPTR